jgi:hypothetical protein
LPESNEISLSKQDCIQKLTVTGCVVNCFLNKKCKHFYRKEYCAYFDTGIFLVSIVYTPVSFYII